MSKLVDLRPRRVAAKLKKDLYNWKPMTLWRYFTLQIRHLKMGGGEFYIPQKGMEDWRLYGDLQNVSHLLQYDWASHVLRDREVGNVLDIACGSGYGSYRMSFDVPRVCAVDPNPQALEYAKENYLREGILFYKLTVDELLTVFEQDYFDAIVSIGTVEHLNSESWVDIFRTLLKNDGVLILSTPVRAETDFHPDNRWHTMEYSGEDLLDRLRVFGRALYGQEMPYYSLFEKANIKFGRKLFAQGPNPIVCVSKE